MNRSYLAITIGPISKTITQAKKTRAVWASSYLFSWIIKQIIIQASSDFDIRLPYSDKIYKSKYGSGLYADRAFLIGDSKKGGEKLQEIVNNVIRQLATEIGGDCETFLQNYFNIHIVAIPFKRENNIEVENGEIYPLSEINKLLDHQELKQNYVFEIEKDHLLEYLTKKINDNTILKIDAFGTATERKFRSLPEIAATSLQRQFPHEFDIALRKDFKDDGIGLFDDEQLQLYLKPHHKYYAVVYADGDNISKLLAKVQEDKDKLKEFSKQLFEFAQKAEKSIAAYGGNGIYLGGEDILAFIPIACVTKANTGQTETIFDLIEKIDKDFNDTVGNFAASKQADIPTLSYGIMMAYIKYPLKEAMNKAHGLLGKAKKLKNKNGIAICFQKHSGQLTGCCIDKNIQASYANLRKLVKDYITEADKNGRIVSGVMHKLNDDLFFSLYTIAIKENRIDALYDNFFNEEIHKVKDSFLKALKSFTINIFRDYESEQDIKNIIFTTLRYVHFINSDKE